MNALPSTPTLKQLQEYVAATERDRDFHDQGAIEKCLLLGEEIGELYKAVRKQSAMGVDPASMEHSVGEELADILNYVLALANRFDIDLESAFREKEIKNAKRTWR